MIDFSFGICHPFNVEFKNYWSKTWSTPFKHKSIELELHTTSEIVGFNFLWTIRRDHAGVNIQLALIGYNLHFNFYDSRHWDYDNNRWENYE